MIPVITWELGTSPGWTLALITNAFLSTRNYLGYPPSGKRFSSPNASFLLDKPRFDDIVINYTGLPSIDFVIVDLLK